MMIAEMTIREATEKDIPKIVELGTEFLLSGPYRGRLSENREQASKYALYILGKTNARIIVSEGPDGVNGVFAFIVFPHYFSGEITAGEIIWYVEPEARAGGVALRLLAEAEKTARLLGAKRMQLTAPSEEVGNLFTRCGGYKKLEVTYQREL